MYRTAGKIRGRKFRDFALKQAFRGINFAICVAISRLCFDISRFRVLEPSLLCLALLQEAVGDLACDVVVLLFGSVSIGFLMELFLVLRLPRPNCTSLEIDPPLLGVPHYRPLIPRFYGVPSNRGLLFRRQRHVQAARRSGAMF